MSSERNPTNNVTQLPQKYLSPNSDQPQGAQVQLININNNTPEAVVSAKTKPKRTPGRKRQSNSEHVVKPKSATLISATTLQPLQIPQTPKKLTIKKIEHAGIFPLASDSAGLK
jgi:hypothetical protein